MLREAGKSMGSRGGYQETPVIPDGPDVLDVVDVVDGVVVDELVGMENVVRG